MICCYNFQKKKKEPLLSPEHQSFDAQSSSPSTILSETSSTATKQNMTSTHYSQKVSRKPTENPSIQKDIPPFILKAGQPIICGISQVSLKREDFNLGLHLSRVLKNATVLDASGLDLPTLQSILAVCSKLYSVQSEKLKEPSQDQKKKVSSKKAVERPIEKEKQIHLIQDISLVSEMHESFDAAIIDLRKEGLEKLKENSKVSQTISMVFKMSFNILFLLDPKINLEALGSIFSDYKPPENKKHPQCFNLDIEVLQYEKSKKKQGDYFLAVGKFGGFSGISHEDEIRVIFGSFFTQTSLDDFKEATSLLFLLKGTREALKLLQEIEESLGAWEESEVLEKIRSACQVEIEKPIKKASFSIGLQQRAPLSEKEKNRSSNKSQLTIDLKSESFLKMEEEKEGIIEKNIESNGVKVNSKTSGRFKSLESLKKQEEFQEISAERVDSMVEREENYQFKDLEDQQSNLRKITEERGFQYTEFSYTSGIRKEFQESSKGSMNSRKMEVYIRGRTDIESVESLLYIDPE